MAESPDFKQLMEKAKEMQNQMKDVQSKIANIKVVGIAGAGQVKITMDGTHSALRVEISPVLLADEDEQMVEDLVAAAINDASKKIEEATKSEMMMIAKDMKLPDGFGGNIEGGDK